MSFTHFKKTKQKKKKANYYNQYFKTNVNNNKSTWKGIKPIVTMKGISFDIPKGLFVNATTMTKLQISLIIIFN